MKINLSALHWGHFCQRHFNVHWIQGLRKLLLLLPSLNNIPPYDQWHTVMGYTLKCCCIWKLWKMDHIILVLSLKLNLKINNVIFHMLLGIWCLSSLWWFHVINVIGYYLWAFLKFNNAACCDVQSFQAMGSFKLQVFSIDCVKSSDKVWNDKNFSKKL